MRIKKVDHKQALALVKSAKFVWIQIQQYTKNGHSGLSFIVTKKEATESLKHWFQDFEVIRIEINSEKNWITIISE